MAHRVRHPRLLDVVCEEGVDLGEQRIDTAMLTSQLSLLGEPVTLRLGRLLQPARLLLLDERVAVLHRNPSVRKLYDVVGFAGQALLELPVWRKLLALLVARVVSEVGLGEHAKRHGLLARRLHELHRLRVSHPRDVGWNDGDNDGVGVTQVAFRDGARARHHVGGLTLDGRRDDPREIDQVERRYGRLSHFDGEHFVNDAATRGHHLFHELPDSRGRVRLRHNPIGTPREL